MKGWKGQFYANKAGDLKKSWIVHSKMGSMYLEKLSHGQGNFKVKLPKLPDKKLEEYIDATCNCHGYKLRFLVKL